MQQHGHDVSLVELDEKGRFDPALLDGFDVVHIYRRVEKALVRKVDELRRQGVAVTWDNDDDPRLCPPESPVYHQVGGFRSMKEFQLQQAIMGRADLVTTTTE